jgi:predicted O-linked N-acetylglucosamine transferase (SPINDLY family)
LVNATCLGLSNVGLPQHVADTPAAFARIAADLAGDSPRLAELRRGLRAQMRQSPLMDRRPFARAFEEALWRKSAGEPRHRVWRGAAGADEPAQVKSHW